MEETKFKRCPVLLQRLLMVQQAVILNGATEDAVDELLRLFQVLQIKLPDLMVTPITQVSPQADEILVKALDARDDYFKKIQPFRQDIIERGLWLADADSAQKYSLNPSLMAMGKVYSFFLFELRRLGVSPRMRRLLVDRLRRLPLSSPQSCSTSNNTRSQGNEDHQDAGS